MAGTLKPAAIWTILAMGLACAGAGCAIQAKRGRAAELPLTSERAIAGINEGVGSIVSLMTQFAVEAEGPDWDGKQSMRGILYWERPDRFRLRANKALSGALLEMGSDGKKIWLYSPSERKVVVAPADDPGEEWFPVLDILRGIVLERMDTNNVAVSDAPGGDCWLVDVPVAVSRSSRSIVRQVQVSKRDGHILRERLLDEGGRVLMDFTFSLYVSRGEVELPREVVVIRPPEQERYTISLKDTKVNVPVKRGLFEPRVPAGTQVVAEGSS